MIQTRLSPKPTPEPFVAGPPPLLLDLVAGFSAEQLKAALEYCRDWNTNSRTCHVAQAMLQAILVRHPPRVRWVQLTNLAARHEGVSVAPLALCSTMYAAHLQMVA